MLAALIGFIVVGIVFGHNLHRVYRCIDKDYSSAPLAGWIIGGPMMLVATIATAIAYFMIWHGTGLTYDQTVERVVLTWMGLVFVPLALGIWLSARKRRREHRARSLYTDNEC